jgi:hypothetical protein
MLAKPTFVEVEDQDERVLVQEGLRELPLIGCEQHSAEEISMGSGTDGSGQAEKSFPILLCPLVLEALQQIGGPLLLHPPDVGARRELLFAVRALGPILVASVLLLGCLPYGGPEPPRVDPQRDRVLIGSLEEHPCPVRSRPPGQPGLPEARGAQHGPGSPGTSTQVAVHLVEERHCLGPVLARTPERYQLSSRVQGQDAVTDIEPETEFVTELPSNAHAQIVRRFETDVKSQSPSLSTLGPRLGIAPSHIGD